MPIFMDRHDIPGITAMDVAEAHKQDLMIQDKYDCRALTYWFDEKRGTAFCLIEAPRKDAVERMHDEAGRMGRAAKVPPRERVNPRPSTPRGAHFSR